MDPTLPVITEDIQDGTPKPPATPEDPNNAGLSEELVGALKRLVQACEEEDGATRREEIKRIQKARAFWRGHQNLAWNDKRGVWVMPEGVHGLLNGIEVQEEVYDYVTNIYRPNGLTYIATLSQQAPKVRFGPQDADQAEDVATASTATKIIQLAHKNNRIKSLLKKVGHLSWTDGTVGFYTRYVVDGEQFGYKTIPVMGEEIREMPSEDPMVPPMQVPVPVQIGEEEVPNGREVIDVVGKLNLKVPAAAESVRDYGYLTWSTEVHKSKIKALYPNTIEKLGDTTSQESDSQERTARDRIITGREGVGQTSEEYLTFKRTWLRPWTFYGLKDKAQTDQLLALYPKGVYVAFAGETYCESRNESMDAYWTVWSALEGEGTVREGVGHDLMDVQERLNTLTNIMTDSFEHSIPTRFVDEQVIDRDAWKNAPPVPGSTMTVKRSGLARLGDGFHVDPGTPLNPQIIMHAQELIGPVAQTVTGIYPALFGGGGVNTDTFRGLELQKTQSQGRIGSIYESFVEAWHQVASQVVECFKENRKEDVKMAVMGPSGRFEAELIRLDDLQGNLEATPEDDQSLPVSQTERRHVLMELLNGQNPALSQLLVSPANWDVFSKSLGMSEVKFPGNDARKKQLREIRDLLKAAPVEVMVPVNDPMTGMPTGQMMPQMQPTIPVDAELEDHPAEAQAGMEWISSDDGQAQKQDNPMGFANARAHILIHKQLADAQMMAQQQAEQAAENPPSKEEKPPAN